VESRWWGLPVRWEAGSFGWMQSEIRSGTVLLQFARTDSSRILTASMSFLKAMWRSHSKHKSEYNIMRKIITPF
jgi:hypothetical protein